MLKIKYIGLPISAWSGKCKQVQTLESFSRIFCCLNFPKCYPNRSACENENISGSLTFLIQSLCDDGCDSRSADICCIRSLGPQWWSLPFENALFSYRCWWSLMAAPIISQFGSPILIQQVNHNDTFTEYICPVNSASCLLPVNLNAPSGHILLHAFFWPRNITVQKQAINKIKPLQ